MELVVRIAYFFKVIKYFFIKQIIGSVAGATAGTVMLPGIGTIIGGIIGGIAGAFSGEYCSNAFIDEIGDLCEYDIIKVRCSYCNYNFKLRKYLTKEEEYYCPVCNHRNV